MLITKIQQRFWNCETSLPGHLGVHKSAHLFLLFSLSSSLFSILFNLSSISACCSIILVSMLRNAKFQVRKLQYNLTNSMKKINVNPPFTPYRDSACVRERKKACGSMKKAFLKDMFINGGYIPLLWTGVSSLLLFFFICGLDVLDDVGKISVLRGVVTVAWNDHESKVENIRNISHTLP